MLRLQPRCRSQRRDGRDFKDFHSSTSRSFRSFDDHIGIQHSNILAKQPSQNLCLASKQLAVSASALVSAHICLCKRYAKATPKKASRTEHSIGHSSQQTARAEGGKPRHSAAKVFSKHLTGIGTCCLSKKAVELKHHHHSSEHQDECKIEAEALGGWQAFRIQSHKRNWPATSLETAIAIAPKCSKTSGSQWKPMRQQKDTPKSKR